MKACQWVNWVGKCHFTGQDREMGCLCGLVVVGEIVSRKGRLIVRSQKETRCLCGHFF